MSTDLNTAMPSIATVGRGGTVHVLKDAHTPLCRTPGMINRSTTITAYRYQAILDGERPLGYCKRCLAALEPVLRTATEDVENNEYPDNVRTTVSGPVAAEMMKRAGVMPEEREMLGGGTTTRYYLPGTDWFAWEVDEALAKALNILASA